MWSRNLLLVLLIMILMSNAEKVEGQWKRPNVVFIIADDMVSFFNRQIHLIIVQRLHQNGHIRFFLYRLYLRFIGLLFQLQI